MTDRKELTVLGDHIGNIVGRLRKNVVKNTTGGTTGGTTVNSTFGYHRWVANPEEGQSGTPPHSELNGSSDDLRLNEDGVDVDRQSGDAASTTDDESSENSTESDPALPKSQLGSSTSINMPTTELPMTKVDTITEWQAGWNVTNAIQV